MIKMPEAQMPLFAVERLRFGVDDPGVRTLVCAANCPLRCRYCINACSWDDSFHAEPFSVHELYDAVRIDNLYSQSTGGGITFGGGEPLLYPEFLIQFARFCPEEWDMQVEASLNVPRKNLELCMDVFSHFYVDIKSMNPNTYTRYTGGTLNTVLDNLQHLLANRGAETVTVRVPLIPDFNDMKEQERSAAALRRLGVINLDLFPYIPKVAGSRESE